jgi:hypothetical protein
MSKLVMKLLIPAGYIASVLLLGACVSLGNKDSSTVSISDTCAPDETLICEVSNTGRIKHGSFSKDGKRCSCSDRRSAAPIIPGVP